MVHQIISSRYVAVTWPNRLAWRHQSLAASWSPDLPDTVATWLPRHRKLAQGLNEGRVGRGDLVRGEDGRQSEGEISSLRRMRERLEGWRRGGGGGERVDKGRRQGRFLIKADHSQQP